MKNNDRVHVGLRNISRRGKTKELEKETQHGVSCLVNEQKIDISNEKH